MSNAAKLRIPTAIFLLFALAGCGHGAPEPDEQIERLEAGRFERGNFAYSFVVEYSGLKSGSVWGDGERLRCSPKTARATAIQWISRNLDLKDDASNEWEVVSLDLIKWPGGRPSEVWIWIAKCEYKFKNGGSSGIPNMASIPVLADGKVPTQTKKAASDSDEQD